jgi:hypothetical protein
MADATAAVAPAVETAQPATEAAAPATASAPDVDIIEAAAERLAEGAEAAEQPEAEAKAEPKEGEPAAEQEPAKPSEALAAEDEALFADEALKTAAGVKNAATRLRVIRAEVKATATRQANTQRSIDYDFRVLKKREKTFEKTKSDHLAWHEVVVASVDLARPRQARGVGNRKRDVALALEQGLHEAGLAGARRRRDDVEGTGRWRAHSRFCTCSRICSISTFSSTATRVSASSCTFEANVFASRFSS